MLFILNTIVYMLNNYCMLKTYAINIEIEIIKKNYVYLFTVTEKGY